jgi:hypothetical protein
MNILKTIKEKYYKVIDYYESIGFNQDLSDIWSNNLPDINNILNNSRTPEEIIDLVDRTFMYSINFPQENAENHHIWLSTPDNNSRVRDKAVDWLLNRQNITPSIEESQYIHYQNKVIRDGKVYSPNFLRCYSIAQRILTYNKSVNSVLELGAGAGHQARTLMMLTNCKYTIVDLPQTLIFSFIHLSLCFPDKKILFVTSAEEATQIDNYEIVLIPPVFMDNLKNREFDVFVNCASMGEMNNTAIRKYMNFIQNDVKIKTLFTLNRFLNTVTNHMARTRVNQNECSVLYDDNWNILNWEIEPVYCRCPYIDSTHSRYVEIIASRPTEQKSISEKINKSNQLLQDVIDEDWYRLRNHFGELIMMAGNNVLQNDTTMTGNIFKLWESIRLFPNINNLQVMVTLLNRLSKNYPFEEIYYYQNKLNEYDSKRNN